MQTFGNVIQIAQREGEAYCARQSKPEASCEDFYVHLRPDHENEDHALMM